MLVLSRGLVLMGDRGLFPQTVKYPCPPTAVGELLDIASKVWHKNEDLRTTAQQNVCVDVDLFSRFT